MPAPAPVPKRAPLNSPAIPEPANGAARRLGLFISDGTLEHEDPNDLAVIYAEYVADYRPTPGVETELVRQLAMATHRLRRLDRMENAAMYNESVAHTRHEANIIMTESFDRAFALMEKIIRARAASERTFSRIYKELETRKAARLAPREAPSRVEIEVDTRHMPQSSTARTRWDAEPMGPTSESPVSRPSARQKSPPRDPTSPDPPA